MKNDFAAVWQALQDAKHFYDRYGACGAVQIGSAFSALERLKVAVDSAARITREDQYRLCDRSWCWSTRFGHSGNTSARIRCAVGGRLLEHPSSWTRRLSGT